MTKKMQEHNSMKKLELTGKKYGKFVVLKEYAERRNGHVQWECKCECGTICIVKGVHLVNGHSQTCGCSRIGHLRAINVTHGLSKSKLYPVWASMKQRCNYEKSESYYRYGKRGISVCKEWNKFEPFYKWAINNGYKEGLSLDRIDNDGNYEPSNCRWATIYEQANNMSTNIKLNYGGKAKTPAQICRKYGIKKDFMYRRLRKGLTIKEIINEHEKA